VPVSLTTVWSIFDYGWIASEVWVAIATRTRQSTGNVRDRGTLILLWIVIFSSTFAGSWIGGAQGPNLPGGAPWLRLASLIVLICGLLLRWSAILTLGKSFSSNVAVHAEQKVLKTGLYHWMRHPSYTGLIVIFIAIGLHTRNWISFLIITIPTTATLLYRIHVEEIALREHFGQEYDDYALRTRRLIPGLY
jgi:protein-S-isoprenylcysteine O-methyltransferase Ste14